MLNSIRKYKLTYQLYNFFQRSALKHNIPLYRKYGLKKTYYDSVSSKDFQHLDSPLNTYDRLDSREHLPEQPAFQQVEVRFQDSLLDWSKNGYAILEGFLSRDEVDAANAEVQRLIDEGILAWKYRNKLMFAIQHSPLLYQIGTDNKLTHILQLLIDKPARLFQSINFYTGSQQATHSDSIHMTTFPLGNLIAVWIALEDIHADSGPLHYYPGSHKRPYVMNPDFGHVSNKYRLGDKDYADYEAKIQQIVKEEGWKKEVFLAKKGDLLIWHANLLHGGEARLDVERTRKSMVFHYYAPDAICYHEVTERPALFKKLKFEAL